jgi:phenolic acid decarboxylase
MKTFTRTKLLCFPPHWGYKFFVANNAISDNRIHGAIIP